MHHKSIIYNKPTRCNSSSTVFINNYKYALHVSDALYALYYSMAEMGVSSHFGHGIVQCAPTLTSIQDLFQPNS